MFKKSEALVRPLALMPSIDTSQLDKLLLRTYDKYAPNDYKYSTDEGNLNPKREVEWDKPVLDQILDRLQLITNDIIRKQIRPQEAEVPQVRSVTAESLPRGVPIQKLAALKMVGGSGDAPPAAGGLPPEMGGDSGNIFGTLFDPTNPIDISFKNAIESILPGMYPAANFEDLDLPPDLDCETILDVFFGKDADGLGASGQDKGEVSAAADKDADDASASAGSGAAGAGAGAGAPGSGDGSGDSGGGAGDGGGSGDSGGAADGSGEGDDGGGADDGDDGSADDNEDYGENDDDFEETDYSGCAKIELGWLKILLIIAKVIAILRKIIDFVLSIVMPIIAIIQLAVGAWLNPTNIAKIAQIVVHLVIAIVVMLIAMIIQMIWDLLNLDCIAAAAEALIAEIKKTLSAFASVTSAFNPTAVGLMLDKVNKGVLDPLSKVADQLKENAEGWRDMANNVREQFSAKNQEAMLKEITDQLKNGIKSGIMSDPNVNRAAAIASSAMQTFSLSKEGALGQAIEAAKKITDTKKLQASAAKSKSSLDKIVSSVKFTGMKTTPRREDS